MLRPPYSPPQQLSRKDSDTETKPGACTQGQKDRATIKHGSNGALVSWGNQRPGRKEFLRKAYSGQWLVSDKDPVSHRLYILCAHFRDEEIKAWKGDITDKLFKSCWPHS